MLKRSFLAEYGLSQNELAKAVGISPNRIAEIVNNRRRITADTALRLGLYFGNSPEFWMNLQTPLRPEIGATESETRRCAADQVEASGVSRVAAEGGRSLFANADAFLCGKRCHDFLATRKTSGPA